MLRPGRQKYLKKMAIFIAVNDPLLKKEEKDNDLMLLRLNSKRYICFRQFANVTLTRLDIDIDTNQTHDYYLFIS